MSWSSDVQGVLRGLGKVFQASANTQRSEFQRVWQNSSLRNSLSDVGTWTEEKLSDAVVMQNPVKDTISKVAGEGLVKGPVAAMKVLVDQLPSKLPRTLSEGPAKVVKEAVETVSKGPSAVLQSVAKRFPVTQTQASSADVPYAFKTYSEHGNQVGNQCYDYREPLDKQQSRVPPEQLDEEFRAAEVWLRQQEHIRETDTDITGDAWLAQYNEKLQREGDMHAQMQQDFDVIQKQYKREKGSQNITEKQSVSSSSSYSAQSQVQFAKGSEAQENKTRPKPLNTNFQPTITEDARERRVPGTRFGRMASFGSLAAGLGVGAVAELARRSLGLTDTKGGKTILDNNPIMTEANVERIVNTLCRVRGAALKLGQMISIQDNSFMTPELQKIFDRVRQSADFMPSWQMTKVLNNEFGSDWKSKLDSFDEKPFAAASIGQVHRATLKDGRQVAMKIQYPGVASSINSDIDNLLGVMKVWKILPEGLYADNAMNVARRELGWECDYKREAECSKVFRGLLRNDGALYVPAVIDELTTGQVLTTELVKGVPLDQCVNLSQDTRNFVGENLLRLCLIELFEFNFMQTDPNWSNFLFDKETNTISLIDFGSSRDFSRKFTDDYLRVIHAASLGDREGVKEYSTRLGFLSGYETQVLVNAHTDAVMILGEAFASEKPFDFGKQTTAAKIHALIPVMLKHRLVPPPEESYSLHRKMAGCFLLCTKLSANISCKPIFDSIYKTYTFGLEKDSMLSER